MVIIMRKKMYLVLLILSLFFLSACSSPVDKFIKDVKKEVGNSIKNTSSKKIKESILYINDNYQKKIDKKVDEIISRYVNMQEESMEALKKYL